MSNKHILLVEDDRVDAMTVQRAVKQLKIENALIIKSDGEKAIEYLQSPDNPKPVFILLDLNMPRMNGIEFLKLVKQDPILRRIPVIILTTSSEQQDRIESFDLSVAGYMVKPVDYNQFVHTFQSIHAYWEMSLRGDE